MNEQDLLKLISEGELMTDLFSEEWDGGDAWGSVMNHLFGIATALYIAGEHIPMEWEFKPGAIQESDLDWPDSEYLSALRSDRMVADDLRSDFETLSVYRDQLRSIGMDY